MTCITHRRVLCHLPGGPRQGKDRCVWLGAEWRGGVAAHRDRVVLWGRRSADERRRKAHRPSVSHAVPDGVNDIRPRRDAAAGRRARDRAQGRPGTHLSQHGASALHHDHRSVCGDVGLSLPCLGLPPHSRALTPRHPPVFCAGVARVAVGGGAEGDRKGRLSSRCADRPTAWRGGAMPPDRPGRP